MKLRHVSPVATYLSIERDDLLNGAELEPSLCRCFSVAQMPTNLKRSASFPVYNIPHVAVATARKRHRDQGHRPFVVLDITIYPGYTEECQKINREFQPKG